MLLLLLLLLLLDNANALVVEECNPQIEAAARNKKGEAAILKTEHETTGLPYSRMVLAGFSQGGALSLYTGLQHSEAMAGIVVMSGYLPAYSKFKLQQKSVPVFHCHGTMDPLVQYPMAEKSQALLKGLGLVDYTLEGFPIQHTVSPAEIGKVKDFLVKVLPPDDSCKITLKSPKDMTVKELKAAIRKAGLGSKAVGLMEKSEFVKLLEDHRDGK